MNKSIENKVTELLEKTNLIENLSRKKFVSMFLVGLISCRNVQFQEVSLQMNSDAKPESTERRIQSFFKDFIFDYAKICAFMLLFLPKGKLQLSIDRTEWDFGKYQCNILMIVAKKGSIAIPLYWQLLDNKSGNSNADDRQNLLEKIIKIIGKNRIDFIVGDREFVGKKWISYLKNNDIPFCMRIPKNHYITLKNGQVFTPENLLEKKTERYFCNCIVDGTRCNVMIKKLHKEECLILIGDFFPKKLGQIYKQRWCIEVLFQNFKARGFNLEDTHLKCNEKLSKLLVFVSIAVGFCTCFGEYLQKKVHKTKMKKHGYLSKSIFRKGLDFIRNAILKAQDDIIEIVINCFDIFIKIAKTHKTNIDLNL
jgi:hypothetical protein